jgi:hypothetical protein
MQHRPRRKLIFHTVQTTSRPPARTAQNALKIRDIGTLYFTNYGVLTNIAFQGYK